MGLAASLKPQASSLKPPASSATQLASTRPSSTLGCLLKRHQPGTHTAGRTHWPPCQACLAHPHARHRICTHPGSLRLRQTRAPTKSRTLRVAGCRSHLGLGAACCWLGLHSRASLSQAVHTLEDDYIPTMEVSIRSFSSRSFTSPRRSLSSFLRPAAAPPLLCQPSVARGPTATHAMP